MLSLIIIFLIVKQVKEIFIGGEGKKGLFDYLPWIIGGAVIIVLAITFPKIYRKIYKKEGT